MEAPVAAISLTGLNAASLRPLGMAEDDLAGLLGLHTVRQEPNGAGAAIHGGLSKNVSRTERNTCGRLAAPLGF